MIYYMLSNYKIQDQTFKMLYKINKSHIDPLLESRDIDQTTDIKKLKYLMTEDKETVVKYIKSKNLKDNQQLENLLNAAKYFKRMSEFIIKQNYFSNIALSKPQDLKSNPFKSLSTSNLPLIISALAMIERDIFENISDSKEMITNANKHTKILKNYKNSITSLTTIKKNIDDYTLFEILNQYMLIVFHSNKLKDQKFDISLITNYDSFKTIIDNIKINYKTSLVKQDSTSNKTEPRKKKQHNPSRKPYNKQNPRGRQNKQTDRYKGPSKWIKPSNQSGGDFNSLEQIYNKIEVSNDYTLHQLLDAKAKHYMESDPIITVEFKETSIGFDNKNAIISDGVFSDEQKTKLDNLFNKNSRVILDGIRRVAPRRLTEQIYTYNVALRDYFRKELLRYKQLLQTTSNNSNNSSSKAVALKAVALKALATASNPHNFNELVQYISNVYIYKSSDVGTNNNTNITDKFKKLSSTSPLSSNRITDVIVAWRKIKKKEILDKNVTLLMDYYLSQKVYNFIKGLTVDKIQPINTLLIYMIFTGSKYRDIKNLIGLNQDFNQMSDLKSIKPLDTFVTYLMTDTNIKKILDAVEQEIDSKKNKIKSNVRKIKTSLVEFLTSSSFNSSNIMDGLTVLNLINLFGSELRDKIIDGYSNTDSNIADVDDLKKDFKKYFTSNDNKKNFKINSFILENILNNLLTDFGNPIILEYYIPFIMAELTSTSSIKTLTTQYNKLIGTIKKKFEKNNTKKYNPLLFFENIHNNSYKNSTDNFISAVLNNKEDANITIVYNKNFYPKLKDGKFFAGNKKISNEISKYWNECQHSHKSNNSNISNIFKSFTGGGGPKKQGKQQGKQQGKKQKKCNPNKEYNFTLDDVNNSWKFKKIGTSTSSFSPKQFDNFVMERTNTSLSNTNTNNNNNNNNNTDRYTKLKMSNTKVELYNGSSWVEVNESINKINKLEVLSITDEQNNNLPLELLTAIPKLQPSSILKPIKILELFQNDKSHSRLINLALVLNFDLKNPGGYKFLFNPKLISKSLFKNFYSINILSLFSLYCTYEYDIFKEQMSDYAKDFPQYRIINKKTNNNNNNNNNFKPIKQTKEQKTIQLLDKYKLETYKRVVEIDRKIKRTTNLQTEQTLLKERNEIVLKCKKILSRYKKK